jgi:hypothetical protein
LQNNADLFCYSNDLHYLCPHDLLHQVITPVAVAQKRVCICAYILQYQSAEAGILLAYIGGVCIVLFDFKLYLLL